MKKMLSVLGVILMTTNVLEAQIHSCDKTQLSGNIVIPTSLFLFAACAPSTDNADGIAVELNGTVSFVVATPAGPANAAGKVAFNVSVVLPGAGNHTVRTASYTALSNGTKQVGPFSSPFVLVLEKVVPVTAPTNHLR